MLQKKKERKIILGVCGLYMLCFSMVCIINSSKTSADTPVTYCNSVSEAAIQDTAQNTTEFNVSISNLNLKAFVPFKATVQTLASPQITVSTIASETVQQTETLTNDVTTLQISEDVNSQIETSSEENAVDIAEEIAEIIEPEPDPGSIIIPESEYVVESTPNLTLLGSFNSTAYTWTGNRCASGNYPYSCQTIDGIDYRSVAVDTNVISLGTRLYIEAGDYSGYCIAEDTGGVIRGNIIDLYMDSYSECINWGRQNITVYLVD